MVRGKTPRARQHRHVTAVFPAQRRVERVQRRLAGHVPMAEAAARRYGLALDAFEAYLVKGGDDITEGRREDVLKDIQSLIAGLVSSARARA